MISSSGTIIFSLSIITVLVITFHTNFIYGFNFDGKTVPCKGVNLTGYPKMKEQYLKCNKTVYKDLIDRGESTDGFGPLLCTALCLFKEDKMIDLKTGKLVKESLKDYEDMFNNMPEVVRADIKKVFYDCFETNKDAIIYNSTDPHQCMGVLATGFCIKTGVDGVCNPEPASEEDKDD